MKHERGFVTVDLNWCDCYEVQVIKFPCPDCGIVTNRSKIKNVVLTITCKGCKKSFKLNYGEPNDVMTCLFCDHVYLDTCTDVKKCPKCKMTTELNIVSC